MVNLQSWMNINYIKNQNVVPFTYEQFEDTKSVIRNCKSKKERQLNDKKKKNKGKHNDVQTTT